MINADSVLIYQREDNTQWAYAESKKEGAPYTFGCPRKRKRPTVPMIRISHHQAHEQGKPDYMIQDGLSNHISGIFFDPVKQKGYGNSRDGKDTFLFDWNQEEGILKVLILLNQSHDRNSDKDLFHLWLEDCVSEKVLHGRKDLDGGDSEKSNIIITNNYPKSETIPNHAG
ncbi:MAG: hypothetical protein PQJ59_12820 [Spirochaetales bacterium]|nr:hypothetical protein [Spirochaetales bacterium]